MANTGFPRASRLLSASDFEAVFANNQSRVANRHFLILALSRQKPGSRLGMVIAKKNIALAVQRNRIRRLIRESFRLSTIEAKQLDIVVLVKRDADKLRNPEITSSLSRLWQDLEKRATHPRNIR